MHLKQLKLAGFKSFVDPTVVHFPSPLVAVVGPNGCGKSNIIDAVRWVMGESSAKNLRGESMTDVIFNGSAQRKSVGQASVELIFDNRLGRLSGPFASYGEISVKRVVTRDGDSTYFLNNSRCRRKDITDIFLGTGAGARSYSIIGQGTISQLIEAKPEELRIFLEEAAGVSKYKERKRETIQRIAQTRDNLARVADIKDELDKQLHRLERQAQAAERYLMLKEQEQLCRGEILALKWNDLVKHHEEKQHQLHTLTVSYEQQQSEFTKINKEKIELNEIVYDADQQTQQTQTIFYQLGTELVRLEEVLQQQTREKKRLEQDQQQILIDWQVAAERLKNDQEELHHSQLLVERLANKVVQLRAQCLMQEAGWQEMKNQQSEWDQKWQNVQTQLNLLQRELHIAHVNFDHVKEKQQHTRLRLEKINKEQESISLEEVHLTKKELEQARIKLIADYQFDEQKVQRNQQHTEQLRAQLHTIEQQLHGLQDDFHHTNSEHAALIAAQHMARQRMHNKSDSISEWADKPRLMDVLQIESKWQVACERVLNETLHAYVLETFPINSYPKQGESLVTMRKRCNKPASYPRLIDKIQGDIPAHVYSLEYIYTAENFNQALQWLPTVLEPYSIITPDGFWLGNGWIKGVNSLEQDELGFLSRQQKITDLSLILEELQHKITELKATRDYTLQQVQKALKDIELSQVNVHASNEALRVNTTALTANEYALDHAEKQAASLNCDFEELQLLLEEIVTEQSRVHEKIAALEKQCHNEEQQQQQFHREKQEWMERFTVKNKAVEEVRALLYQAELEWDKEKNKIQQLEERIQREQAHSHRLHERLEQLALLCLQAESPSVDIREQLAQHVQKHSEVELQLALSREQVSQLRMKLEEYEKNILNCDADIKRMQELISQARLEEQTFIVRASSVQESLAELGLQAEELFKHISVGATQSMREDELIALTEEIKRLGAINLAAIEEFTTEKQRKLYLDKQHGDLSEALSTLEMAMEKMDRETRSRLEHTYCEVNASFQSLFPRLFGGGRAQLELKGDNLLEAGIVVMAQPPGKRNTTIHLLSGGEKAMTAVALVFALFQLNPSPFCMLDEVDAPLDDVNVGRFCALVKDMSQFVQFLFITHNKITMELADHLIGVTMREPGVSRLVAVDVTQALAME